MMELIASHHGNVSSEHGVGSRKRGLSPMSRQPADIAVIRTVKAALDPTGYLNPAVLLTDARRAGPWWGADVVPPERLVVDLPRAPPRRPAGYRTDPCGKWPPGHRRAPRRRAAGSTATWRRRTGACRNAGKCVTSDSPGGAPSMWPGSSAVMRADMKAAMPALPSTRPTCRVVFADARNPHPASRGGRLLVAVAPTEPR